MRGALINNIFVLAGKGMRMDSGGGRENEPVRGDKSVHAGLMRVVQRPFHKFLCSGPGRDDWNVYMNRDPGRTLGREQGNQSQYRDPGWDGINVSDSHTRSTTSAASTIPFTKWAVYTRSFMINFGTSFTAFILA